MIDKFWHFSLPRPQLWRHYNPTDYHKAYGILLQKIIWYKHTHILNAWSRCVHCVMYFLLLRLYFQLLVTVMLFCVKAYSFAQCGTSTVYSSILIRCTCSRVLIVVLPFSCESRTDRREPVHAGKTPSSPLSPTSLRLLTEFGLRYGVVCINHNTVDFDNVRCTCSNSNLWANLAVSKLYLILVFYRDYGN